MLTMLLGRDWTANQQAVLDMIAEDVNKKRTGIILMVPELISHDTERRLCMAAGDTASRYAQVLSFSRLARRICDLVGSGATACLDDGGRLVAMASAVNSLHSRLKAYAALETKPEFLEALVDAVDEFKRCCITPEDLRMAASQASGSLAQRLEELSLILESYDSVCSRGQRDPREQMNWVLEQLQEIDYAQSHTLYLDGFPDLTRQNMAILEHFILHCPRVIVSLNCDRIGSKELIFEKAGQTARDIKQIADRAGVPVNVQYIKERSDLLQPVRAGLFQGKAEADADFADKLRLYESQSVYQACQTAAVEILQLIRAGSRYRDISIACPDMSSYRATLGLVLGKCGIPVYLSGTEDVLQSGVVATVTSALDAAIGGFEQKAVLRYLRSTLSPLDADTCDLVENYVHIWRIDRKQWTHPWTMHPQGLSGQWDADFDAQLQRLEAARAHAMLPLLHLAQRFQTAANLHEQVMGLYTYWEETSFADRIALLADDFDARGDNRSAQMLNQLWEILLSAAEQLHDVLGQSIWNSENFTKLFKILLSQYNVGTIPTVLDSVSVGPVSAQRCQQQKHLIVLGADEGSLPGYGGATGLLNDQERVQLRSLGLPLTGGSVDGLQAEFAEIYGVFCGAQESICMISAGEPSFVFKRLAKMAGGCLPIDPDPVDTITDIKGAAAYLARWQAKSAAEKLGLKDAYLDALFRRSYHLGQVQPENVRKLYGQQLSLSASQIDKQAVCRLAYFLQYGLRARERKEATVDPAEFGTFVHTVLEKTARDVMTLGGFRQVDLDQTLRIADEYANAYIAEHFVGLDSQRMQYLFRRNVQELQSVVKELWRELHEAQYTPAEFEMQFGFGGDMPPIAVDGTTMEARLRGLVDRVDTWQKADSTYFRVIDYKTGKKDFDYCDVYNGVGLQMLLYLFALEEEGKTLGAVRVPAGVQYFPARAPYISADNNLSQEEADKERLKSLKRQGLLLNDEASLRAMDPSEKMDTLCCTPKKDGSISGDVADRDQLYLLKAYVRSFLSDMVDVIASGQITANPYTRGSSYDACTFCPYGAVCHKDSVAGRRNYKTMSAQRFWEEIGKEADKRG